MGSSPDGSHLSTTQCSQSSRSTYKLSKVGGPLFLDGGKAALNKWAFLLKPVLQESGLQCIHFLLRLCILWPYNALRALTIKWGLQIFGEIHFMLSDSKWNGTSVAVSLPFPSMFLLHHSSIDRQESTQSGCYLWYRFLFLFSLPSELSQRRNNLKALSEQTLYLFVISFCMWTSNCWTHWYLPEIRITCSTDSGAVVSLILSNLTLL